LSKRSFKVAKTLKEVSMWVHPEGLVQGALFLRADDEDRAQEEPRTVLNTHDPFCVLKRKNPDEIRFYNRSSIIRVEYSEPYDDADPQLTQMRCHLLMMDGSMISGEIRENLSPERARLYDYLNKDDDRFIKIFTGDDQICLVNKAYVIQVTPGGKGAA
jgi:hypothetical protein